MTDNKDAEIAELKAQLQGATKKAGGGFAGGFFGCFGVGAAVLLVLFVLLVIAQYNGMERERRADIANRIQVDSAPSEPGRGGTF